MKKLFFLVIMSFSANFINAQLQQTNYHIRNKVIVNNIDIQLTKLVLMLPLAQTNQYQTVSNVNVYDGVIVNIPETDDKYVRWIFTSSLPSAGQAKEIYYDFDVTLNPVNFDFNQITAIYPYNTASDNYLWYTGASGIYVDPNNSTIQNIGNNLWVQSSDIVDYARRCYIYVAANYNYLNPNTGLHSLQDILTAGGGDCGNLTSIFVSLLRHKNIPARHIVTVRPDGLYHVWSDFYLENYGWIPVDVTYKNSNPSGDYFGKYDGNGIVVTKEVWLQMDRGDGDTYYTSLLQTYNWWYWCSSGGNNINSSHNLSSTPYTGIQDMEAITDFSIYPNPANDIITIENSSINKSKEGMISIYDIQGQLLLRQPLFQEKSEINISSFTKGIYLVKINYSGKTKISKIIIQ